MHGRNFLETPTSNACIPPRNPSMTTVQSLRRAGSRTTPRTGSMCIVSTSGMCLRLCCAGMILGTHIRPFAQGLCRVICRSVHPFPIPHIQQEVAPPVPRRYGGEVRGGYRGGYGGEVRGGTGGGTGGRYGGGVGGEVRGGYGGGMGGMYGGGTGGGYGGEVRGGGTGGRYGGMYRGGGVRGIWRFTHKAVHTEGGAHTRRCTQKPACSHRRSLVI